jgi:hypothetical protein
MADLDFLERSSPVQLVGGDEQYPADISIRKELSTSDTIRENLISGSLSVGTTAVEVKVGASRLANRKSIALYNNSNRTMWWGGSGVTPSSGVPINKGELLTLAIEDVAVFVVSDQASQDSRVIEAL